jgi:hypothetical protein
MGSDSDRGTGRDIPTAAPLLEAATSLMVILKK